MAMAKRKKRVIVLGAGMVGSSAGYALALMGIVSEIILIDQNEALAVAQASWAEFLPWLRSGPGQLVGASLRDAQPYRGAPYQAPCFILVGNESQGLPEDYEAACDLRVTMPMKGRADSLNAAVAGAVLAYEVLAGFDR